MFRYLTRLLSQLTFRFRIAFLGAVAALITRLVAQLVVAPTPAHAHRDTARRRGRVIDGEAHRL